MMINNIDQLIIELNENYKDNTQALISLYYIMLKITPVQWLWHHRFIEQINILNNKDEIDQ